MTDLCTFTVHRLGKNIVLIHACVFVDSEKTAEQRAEEDQILQQMLEVVDMRNSLVAFLEEKRLKEVDQEQLDSSLLENKRLSTAGAQVRWA